MSHRTTIHLEDEAFAFLQSASGDNRSAYINRLILREKQRALSDALLKANQEEAGEDYMEDLAAWDEALADGLNAPAS